MDTGQVADQLLTNGDIESDDVRTFVDRLMLRIFSVTSLMQHLNAVNVDGKKIQLVFNLIPQEVVPDIHRLIGVDDVKTLTFKGEEDNAPFVGFEINLDPELFDQDNPAERSLQRATLPQAKGLPFEPRR